MKPCHDHDWELMPNGGGVCKVKCSRCKEEKEI